MRYFIRRILYNLFLLLGVSILSFSFVDFARGDFFDEMKLNPQISAATIAELRAHYGLDRPLPIQYIHWLHSVLKGEWGFSFAYNSPATAVIGRRAFNTLLLTGTATVLSWLIAIPLGIWSAYKQGKTPDRIAGGMVSTLLAIPELVLALILLLIAVRSGHLPVGGVTSLDFSEMGFWARCEDLARHLLLPSLCLAAGSFPLLLSHVRSAMVEVLESPFIAATRAHGIPLLRLLFRHALPAAANPLISLFGLSIGILLSSSLLVEGLFSWPGLGQLLIEATLQRDFYLVVDAATLATFFLIAGNLLADVLLYASDPRIRTQ